MTKRGFFKEVSGTYRLRSVRAGEDVDDLDLDPNLVSFDSTMFKTVPIYTSGIWTGTITTTLTKIISWTSPGFVPMVSIWRVQSTDVDTNFDAIYEISPITGTVDISAKADGIYAQYSSSISRTLRYIVWNLNANG